jgi:hypothetical protein
MANTKLKTAHILINNVFTKSTPINLWIYVGTPPTSSFPPQAIQHSFFSDFYAYVVLLCTALYSTRPLYPGLPGVSNLGVYMV